MYDAFDQLLILIHHHYYPGHKENLFESVLHGHIDSRHFGVCLMYLNFISLSSPPSICIFMILAVFAM